MINIIFIIICIILFFYNTSEFFTYKLCNKKNVIGLHKKTIVKNNLTRTNENNWNLYLPCGYKFVEKEISNIDFNENNNYIFGISGSDKLASKNNIWNILRNYYGIYNASQIMPITYILDNNNDMLVFQKNYSVDKIYILKKNIQRKLGLQLIKNDINTILTADKKGFKIVQEYIENPFLVNGFKLNIRVYLLIICNNTNKKCFLHKKGKCLYTKYKYNNNLEFDKNITSYMPDKNIYNNNPLTLEDLYKYIDNSNNDSIIVKKKIKSIMIKLSNSIKDHICNKKKLYQVTTFQLFGVDIILDDKLNPKLLELNKGPNMIPINEDDVNIKQTVYNDVYNKTIYSIENDFEEL